ncbi:IS1182 family transposase [Clostridium massiliamazoniense]|uniref:IS1182 family transposase n=1 Tax=Clostridium massiliamazoniense TaxID=1347366 RepID=UPI0006D7C353|nr:IS1182 family transposase [Clostridium massiliamazoniense]
MPEDYSVRLLFKVTEGLNYSKLYETYSTLGRNPTIVLETLFRIIIYGNMERTYSSRDLEKAYRRDINFK